MGNGGSAEKKSRGGRKQPPTKEQLEWRELAKEDKDLYNEQNQKLFASSLAPENIENSRVKLSCKNEHEADYINANYVDGVHADSKHFYIASQAPLPGTLEDFWRMIWEEKVEIIVMLTNLVEGTTAHQYWPSVGTKKYGKYSVTKKDVIENDAFVLRSFTLKEGALNSLKDAMGQRSDGTDGSKSKSRTVYQYHYKIWPDFGVPDEAGSLLRMMINVESKMAKVREKNIHCSAGIGRTGSYVVIDSVSRRFRETYGLSPGPATVPVSDDLRQEFDELSLRDIVSGMRRMRVGFVQQRAQYLFCYRAIRQYLLGEATPAADDVGRKEKDKEKVKTVDKDVDKDNENDIEQGKSKVQDRDREKEKAKSKSKEKEKEGDAESDEKIRERKKKTRKKEKSPNSLQKKPPTRKELND